MVIFSIIVLSSNNITETWCRHRLVWLFNMAFQSEQDFKKNVGWNLILFIWIWLDFEKLSLYQWVSAEWLLVCSGKWWYKQILNESNHVWFGWRNKQTYSLAVDKEIVPLFCGVTMSKVISPIKLSSILAHSSHLVIWLIIIWSLPWSIFCTYIILIILHIVVVLRKYNTCQSLF